jgi:hypothetical protein
MTKRKNCHHQAEHPSNNECADSPSHEHAELAGVTDKKTEQVIETAGIQAVIAEWSTLARFV